MDCSEWVHFPHKNVSNLTFASTLTRSVFITRPIAWTIWKSSSGEHEMHHIWVLGREVVCGESWKNYRRYLMGKSFMYCKQYHKLDGHYYANFVR